MQGNKVWQGIEAIKNARAMDGKHPLVILSHGIMGTAMAQAWLAQSLSQRGYIVAGVHHPGTSFFADEANDRRELWRRPQDISRIIDDLLSDNEFASVIDSDRIFAVGHSLGGMTVMSAIGAGYDQSRVDTICDDTPDDLVCTILDDWNIGKTPADIAALEQDATDPRIKAAVLFDMGGAQTFAPASLAKMTTPVLIYGATAGHVDLDRNSRLLAETMPSQTTQYLEMSDYAHFDFMGLCTENGLDILQKYEPQDVEVCTDGRALRAAKHSDIVTQVTQFFATQD